MSIQGSSGYGTNTMIVVSVAEDNVRVFLFL